MYLSLYMFLIPVYSLVSNFCGVFFLVYVQNDVYFVNMCRKGMYVASCRLGWVMVVSQAVELDCGSVVFCCCCNVSLASIP